MGNIKVDKNKAQSGRGRGRNEGREGETEGQKKRTCTSELPKIEPASIFRQSKNSHVPLPLSVTCLV